MGASIMIVEGGTYNDTNGLILADSLHQANTAQQAKLGTERYPASQDPKFKDANLPQGYLTTKPNTRGGGFYAAQYADPNVIAKDEDLKQTVTTGEISTLSAGRDPKNSMAITTPVLLVVGAEDSINCNEAIGLSCKDSATVLNREHTNYGAKTCLEAYVLQQSGHDTNLHRTAQDWFKEATSWIQRRVGNGDTKPTNACQV
jgi:alpha-beta hydrolase superfamily lysophospholipase